MIKLALIGAGKRGWDLAMLARQLPEPAFVTVIVDPEPEAVRQRINTQDSNNNSIMFFKDIDSFMQSGINCDGVIIASRCSTHTDLALRVATLNKPIFLEKPVAINTVQLQSLWQSSLMHRQNVVVSFPLRLTPLFQAVQQIVASGRLGKINQIQAYNNVAYGGVYFGQWYRQVSEAGGLWLQKATHDFDYINALIGARPLEIAATGTRAVYGGQRPCNLKCSQCPDTATCLESPIAHRQRQDDGGMAYGKPGDDHACAFSECIVNDDASSALILYEGGVHATYTQNFISRRSAGRRGAIVTGYQATLIFNWTGGASQIISHFDRDVETLDVPPAIGGHDGGDAALLRNFINVIHGREASRCSLAEGVVSAAMCLAATRSAATHTFQSITLDEKSLSTHQTGEPAGAPLH